MEILIAVILILFIYLFYIFNELTKINVSIKESFIEMEISLKKRIDLSKKLEEEIKKDEQLNKMAFSEEYINLKKDVKNIKNWDKEDQIQNNIINKYNEEMIKVNSISLFIAERDKMIDLGIKEDILNTLNQIIIEINQEKNNNLKNKEKYNKLVNMSNKYITKFPSKFIAKILGFSEYYNIK